MKRSFGASALVLASVLLCRPATAQDQSTDHTGGSDQPGATDSGSTDSVIHLHMPVHHVQQPPRAPDTVPPAAAPTESTPPASVDVIGAGPALPAPAPRPSSKHSEAPAPANVAAHESAPKAAPAIPFSFGDDSEVAPQPRPTNSAAPVRTAGLPPHPGPAQTTKPLANGERAGLAKRGAVMFEKGASDPSPAQFKGVKLLAGDLSSALESGASRIEVDAYAGAPGDKSSDARRLSLKRALAVRQLLIDGGVPSARIDVRAMGGIDDEGAPDRVDVFVRS